MTRTARCSGLLLGLALTAPAAAADKDDGFVPMFNGKDLSGWVNVNCDAGTFFVKGNEIVTTGKPTGFLRTAKQYENFVLELEWMHVNTKEPGNSGVFVWGDPLPAVGSPYTRGIEVQVLVNAEVEGSYTSHGDVFSIWGATCKPDRPHPKGAQRCLPSEKRAKGGGEWNHYRITANNGVIKLAVNGKEVSGVSECKPRKGYLALESEGAECHFRNIRIKELPSTSPKPDEVADEAKEGFVNLLAGPGLPAWMNEAAKKHWQRRDWRLAAVEDEKELQWTKDDLRDFELIADMRLVPKKDVENLFGSAIILRGEQGVGVLAHTSGGLSVFLRPKKGDEDRLITRAKGKVLKPLGQWNRIHATLKGDQLSLTVNGEAVLRDHKVPDVPAKGPISLSSVHGEAEFANVFVRELK